MYHYTLRILLCCSDASLESSLRDAAPLPGFAHAITPTCANDLASLPALAQADIVLLDAPALEQLPAMRSAARADALFVCVDAGAAGLNERHLCLLDEVWAGTSSTALCSFYVSRLLERARRQKTTTLPPCNSIQPLISPLILCGLKTSRASTSRSTRPFAALWAKAAR